MDGGTESLTGKETNMTRAIWIYAVKPSESRTATSLRSLSADEVLLVPMFQIRPGDEIVAVFCVHAQDDGSWAFTNESVERYVPGTGTPKRRELVGDEIERMIGEIVAAESGQLGWSAAPVRLGLAPKQPTVIEA